MYTIEIEEGKKGRAPGAYRPSERVGIRVWWCFVLIIFCVCGGSHRDGVRVLTTYTRAGWSLLYICLRTAATTTTACTVPLEVRTRTAQAREFNSFSTESRRLFSLLSVYMVYVWYFLYTRSSFTRYRVVASWAGDGAIFLAVESAMQEIRRLVIGHHCVNY